MPSCPHCGKLIPTIEDGRKGTMKGPFDTRAEFREAVLADLDSGMMGVDVAKKYGCSDSLISKIRHGDFKTYQ